MIKFIHIHRRIAPQIVISMRSAFVKNARSLETLKANVSEDDFKKGKFMIMLQDQDLVLLEDGSRTLKWLTEGDCMDKVKFSSSVVLDVAEDSTKFAVDIPAVGSLSSDELGKQLGGFFCHFRKALFMLDMVESNLLSQAKGLLHFKRTTLFCKYCGAKLDTGKSSVHKLCSSCKTTHYPTISPVGIVLIENKTHDKVLLARGARHPPGMFSCLAGFVEPGESLNDNIRREVAEEVGIEISNIKFIASQHWAMPDSQLMLGCIATACSEDFEIDPVELESAQWVDATLLSNAVTSAKGFQKVPPGDKQTLWVPPPAAVAHTLMESWLQTHHGYVAPVISHI